MNVFQLSVGFHTEYFDFWNIQPKLCLL